MHKNMVINIHLNSFGSSSISGSDILQAMYKAQPNNSYSIVGIKSNQTYIGSASYDTTTDVFNYNMFDNIYQDSINNDNQTIIAKNGILRKTIQNNNRTEIVDVKTNSKYPFSIELEHSSSDNAYLKFSRSDGNLKPEIISNLLTNGSFYHFVCQKTGSQLEMYINGTLISSGSDYSNIPFNIIGGIGDTHNDCDTFIGSLGGYSQMYNGSLDELKIYNRPLTINQIAVLATNELSGSYEYVIGNVFYDCGIITVNQPNLIAK